LTGNLFYTRAVPFRSKNGPKVPLRDAIQFAAVSLPFGLASNPFMWIWDLGHGTRPRDKATDMHGAWDRAIGHRTGHRT